MAQFGFKKIPLIFVFDSPIKKGDFITNASNFISEAAGQGPDVLLIKVIAKILKLKNLDNKIILPLLVNPQKLNITKQPKVITAFTKKGLLAQYWPAIPDTISIAGMAASNHSLMILNQLDLLTRTMEEGIRNPITMLYKFGLGNYRGYIENFKVGIDATYPNVFNYTFDFKFLDKDHFRMFLYAITTTSLNTLIQNPMKAIKDQLSMGATEIVSSSNITGNKALLRNKYKL